jgi:hypothetical protein
MNSTHLGDALDHWKGSIIKRLQDKCLVRELSVIPMITLEVWSKEVLSAYSKLLNLNSDDSVLKPKEVFEHTHRDTYFTGIDYSGDLFIDPDTGVSNNPKQGNDQYITLDDIKGLLDKGKEHDPVIMVYQHRNPEEDWVQKKVAKIEVIIREQMEGCLTLRAYDFGIVAMLFFSNNKDSDRIKAIEDDIKTILPRNTMIKDRIYPRIEAL